MSQLAARVPVPAPALAPGSKSKSRKHRSKKDSESQNPAGSDQAPAVTAASAVVSSGRSSRADASAVAGESKPPRKRKRPEATHELGREHTPTTPVHAPVPAPVASAADRVRRADDRAVSKSRSADVARAPRTDGTTRHRDTSAPAHVHRQRSERSAKAGLSRGAASSSTEFFTAESGSSDAWAAARAPGGAPHASSPSKALVRQVAMFSDDSSWSSSNRAAAPVGRTSAGETKSARPLVSRAAVDPLDGLTAEQRDAFDELSRALPDAAAEAGLALTPWVSTACICRYLRARAFNVPKALKMLLATLAWRAEYGVDGLTVGGLESEIENAGKMYMATYHDVTGRPVVYMKPRHDNTTDRLTKVQYLVYLLELAIKRMDGEGGVETMTWIVDFADYRQLTGIRQIGVSKDTASVLQNHYPERLGCVFMVNQPWVFNVFWAAVRPLIDRRTVDKIHFLKGDFGPIADVVPRDLLEESYGGEGRFEYSVDAWRALCEQWEKLPPVY